MTQEDFCEAYDAPGIGELQGSILDELKQLRKDLMTEVSRQEIDPGCHSSRRDHIKLQEAATAMRHHFVALEQMLQPFVYTVVTLTSFQRSYLETRALLDKIQKFNKRYSLCDTPSCWPVDNSLMGIVTDRISLVHELYLKGVPVWFVRSAASVSSATNIVKPMALTRPGASNGVVLEFWPNLPIPYQGPRTPMMYATIMKWQPGVLTQMHTEPDTQPTVSQKTPENLPARQSQRETGSTCALYIYTLVSLELILKL